MHRMRASRFCRNFLSHRTETKSFVNELFHFPEIFWCRKNFWIRRGVSRFSVEIFMSHSAANFRKRVLLFLGKILVLRIFMDEKGGIMFFRRMFLVPQCRKLSWASLQCFRKFGVSKIFMHSRGYHNFPSKLFCLTAPKNSVGDFFQGFRKFGVSKRIMHNRGYHNFPSKLFCLTVTTISVGIPSMFQKIWGIEKNYA